MFVSREDAGQRLGQRLREDNVQANVVVGLPRGGVIVAAEAARVLDLPLDVVIVRKIGHPRHREFAVGALAENGVVVWDEDILERTPALREQLIGIIEEEKDRLRTYQARFHQEDLPDFSNKVVLLIDDGIATGATTEAGVLALRKQHAKAIIVAAPVASTSAAERLLQVADDVRALLIDPEFDAVGRYYDSFPQATDEEVLQLLRRSRHFVPGTT